MICLVIYILNYLKTSVKSNNTKHEFYFSKQLKYFMPSSNIYKTILQHTGCAPHTKKIFRRSKYCVKKSSFFKNNKIAVPSSLHARRA